MKKLNPKTRLVCDDMLNDLAYLGKFDGFIVIVSIIHMLQEKLNLCFKRICDVLSDGGVLAMFERIEEGNF